MPAYLTTSNVLQSAEIHSESVIARKAEATEPQSKHNDDDNPYAIPPLDFIRSVWKLDSANLHLDKWKFELLPELCKHYKSMQNNPEDRHVHLAALLTQALTDYLKTMKSMDLEAEVEKVCRGFIFDDSGAREPYILNKDRRSPHATALCRLVFPRMKEFVEGITSRYRPSPGPSSSAPPAANMVAIWDRVLAYFVFEDIDPISGWSTLPDTEIPAPGLPTSEPAPCRGPSPMRTRPVGPPKEHSLSLSETRVKYYDRELSIPPFPKDQDQEMDTNESEDDDDYYANDRYYSSDDRPKRYPIKEVAEHYASQAFENEARHWTSGIIVKGCSMSLWYHDRMGFMRAAPFDFIEKPECLLALVVALASAEYEDFGFDPMIIKRGANKRKGESSSGPGVAAREDGMDVDQEADEVVREIGEKAFSAVGNFFLTMKLFQEDPTGGLLHQSSLGSFGLGRTFGEDGEDGEDGGEYESLLTHFARIIQEGEATSSPA